MFTWLKDRAQDRRTAIELYGAIVTQARKPAFFAVSGVEDTPEGRTAMIIALMFPVLEKLSADGQGRVARYLSETFVTDVDDSLREMGVGDMSVPKKVKRAAQALGERCLAYRRAAKDVDPIAALSTELATTVPGLGNYSAGAVELARRLMSLHDHLAPLQHGQLIAGIAGFSATAESASHGCAQAGRTA